MGIEFYLIKDIENKRCENASFFLTKNLIYDRQSLFELPPTNFNADNFKDILRSVNEVTGEATN